MPKGAGARAPKYATAFVALIGTFIFAGLAVRRSLLGTWFLNLGLSQSDPDSVP